MKLVRYGDMGYERPGVLDNTGHVHDLGAIVSDISGEALAPGMLEHIRQAVNGRKLPRMQGSVRFGPCVSSPSKIVCVGLNYHEHIREIGAETPQEPVLFMKAPSSLSGPYDDVRLPPGSTTTDWEIELGAVIGTRATRIPVSSALSHVAGYCIVNDVSERSWQLSGTGQWVKGKSADTFAPVGPWLTTSDEIRNPQNLNLALNLNGQQQQTANTADMVFCVDYLISYISQFMTLLPGDIVSTGTPHGVGMAQHPPRYLKENDVVELTIDGLGAQRQRVVALRE